VRDLLFTSGSPFFDLRDLVQVKYELLRRVRVDGYSVSQATSLFALSRPTFYAAQSAWEQAGMSGLLPQSTGPRHAHKLTEEIVAELRPLAKAMSAAELAGWLQEQRGLWVHPRSIERALARHQRQKGGIMKLSGLELTYEAARTWALHPVSHPPSGWAQLVRCRIATWVQETPQPLASSSPSREPAHLGVSPLLTLVAAMIAEVCQ